MTVKRDELKQMSSSPATGNGIDYLIRRRASATTGMKESTERKIDETMEKTTEEKMMERMKGDLPKKLPGY